MADLNNVQVSATVDARGSACPGPLLEAKKGIGKVKVGEVLEVLSSDPGTRTDLKAWALLKQMDMTNIILKEPNNRWCYEQGIQREDTYSGH